MKVSEWFKWFAGAVSNLLPIPTLRTDGVRAVFVGLLAVLWISPARADKSAIDAFADYVTRARPYRGKTVPFPDNSGRPDAGLPQAACSELLPLCVHAAPAFPRARLLGALSALEAGLGFLGAQGWPLPYPDGGRGGGPEFDVYLQPAAAAPAQAAAEEPLLANDSELDGATAYAVLDAALPDAALEACAISALTQAGLLARDPAEPRAPLLAAALFAQWQYGFDLDASCEGVLSDSQRAPELGTLGDDDRQITAAALQLVLLSRRHDGGSGRFVRGFFELARQRSAGPSALHVEPSVQLARARALEHAGESLDRSAEEFAIARYLAPFGQGALPRLPAAAQVALRSQLRLAALPRHVIAAEPGLATYGSAYVRVDTAGAPAGAQLQVWLRGEPGARWSLAALRLDAQGRERGRMVAPPRRLPESFLPVELDPDTHAVVIAVTKLAKGMPPANAGSPDDRHYFRLVIDVKRP
jgi:hypothetical protein